MIHSDGNDGLESVGMVGIPSGLVAMVDLHAGLWTMGLGILAVAIGQIRYQWGVANVKIEREKILARMDSHRDFDKLRAPELEKELDTVQEARRRAEAEAEAWKQECAWLKKKWEKSVATPEDSRSLYNEPYTASIDADTNSGRRARDEPPADRGVEHHRLGKPDLGRPDGKSADLDGPGPLD